MAVQRTYEEKAAIVSHCIELEKSGGDILGYLWSENYLTPRATWCNFQREWLGRKPYQYTDGKPKKKKGEKDMGRPGVDREATVPKLMEAIRAGQDPREFMKTVAGVTNPTKAYQNMRLHIRKYYPELAAELPTLRNSYGKTVKPPKSATKPEAKANTEPLQLEAGKNYELQAPVKEAEEPKAEEQKTEPLACDGFTVRCIECDFGKFYYDAKFGLLDWTSPDGEEVSFTPEAWKQFATEALPKAMAILGVIA